MTIPYNSRCYNVNNYNEINNSSNVSSNIEATSNYTSFTFYITFTSNMRIINSIDKCKTRLGVIILVHLDKIPDYEFHCKDLIYTTIYDYITQHFTCSSILLNKICSFLLIFNLALKYILYFPNKYTNNLKKFI
jgi:hypothetical protein